MKTCLLGVRPGKARSTTCTCQVLESNGDDVGKIFQRKIEKNFLSISVNICFGCSNEPSLLSTHNICCG